jgi:hypothetical protein
VDRSSNSFAAFAGWLYVNAGLLIDPNADKSPPILAFSGALTFEDEICEQNVTERWQ